MAKNASGRDRGYIKKLLHALEENETHHLLALETLRARAGDARVQAFFAALADRERYAMDTPAVQMASLPYEAVKPEHHDLLREVAPEVNATLERELTTISVHEELRRIGITRANTTGEEFRAIERGLQTLKLFDERLGSKQPDRSLLTTLLDSAGGYREVLERQESRQAIGTALGVAALGLAGAYVGIKGDELSGMQQAMILGLPAAQFAAATAIKLHQNGAFRRLWNWASEHAGRLAESRFGQAIRAPFRSTLEGIESRLASLYRKTREIGTQLYEAASGAWDYAREREHDLKARRWGTAMIWGLSTYALGDAVLSEIGSAEVREGVRQLADLGEVVAESSAREWLERARELEVDGATLAAVQGGVAGAVVLGHTALGWLDKLANAHRLGEKLIHHPASDPGSERYQAGVRIAQGFQRVRAIETLASTGQALHQGLESALPRVDRLREAKLAELRQRNEQHLTQIPRRPQIDGPFELDEPGFSDGTTTDAPGGMTP